MREFPAAASALGAQVVEVIPSPPLQNAVDELMAEAEAHAEARQRAAVLTAAARHITVRQDDEASSGSSAAAVSVSAPVAQDQALESFADLHRLRRSGHAWRGAGQLLISCSPPNLFPPTRRALPSCLPRLVN